MTKSISGLGVDYEAQCSSARLAGMGIAAPKMGYESTIARKDGLVLVVQNVAGILLLASHNVQALHWAKTFGPQFSYFSERACKRMQVDVDTAFINAVKHQFEVSEVPPSDVRSYGPRVTEHDEKAAHNDVVNSAVENYGRDKGLRRHMVEPSYFARQRG